jgi:hypothetical protein
MILELEVCGFGYACFFGCKYKRNLIVPYCKGFSLADVDMGARFKKY